jgi:KTSC domain
VADATLAMEMKRLTGGNLRSAGYDDKNRMLVVELSSGTFQYTGVTAETWRRFASASSPWSFFRDNIDEEYPAKRIR